MNSLLIYGVEEFGGEALIPIACYENASQFGRSYFPSGDMIILVQSYGYETFLPES